MPGHWTEFLDAATGDDRLLPWKLVQKETGLSRTTAWRLQKDGQFPSAVVLSPGRVGYRQREIEAWKRSRVPRCEMEPRPPTPRRGPPAKTPAVSTAPTRPPAARTPDPAPAAPQHRPRSPVPRPRPRLASLDQLMLEF